MPTSLLANGGWLSSSKLKEAGIKFQLVDGRLVGSLAGYEQHRTQLTQGGGVTTVRGTEAQGLELELRFIASDNFSLTFVGNKQETTVKGPDKSFAYLPARLLGVPPVNGFGGAYVTFDFSTTPGRAGDYEYKLIPETVFSLYGTYTTDDYDWGRAGLTLGGTHVSETAQTVQDAIVFPSFWVFNASAFVEHGPYQLSVNVDNLADKLYFTPAADSYANLGALPSIGREWRVTLKRKF